MQVTYVCPICSSTKTVTKPYYMSITLFEETFPKKIFCGVKGCHGDCVPDYGR